MSDTRPYVYAYQALQKRWAFTPLNGQTFVRNHVALERWSKYRFVMCRTTYSHAQADQMTRLAANGQLDEPFVRLFTVMDTLEGNQVVMAVVKPLDTDHEIRLRLADGSMKTCIWGAARGRRLHFIARRRRSRRCAAACSSSRMM